jgi:rRNA-processing protein FCF1
MNRKLSVDDLLDRLGAHFFAGQVPRVVKDMLRKVRMSHRDAAATRLALEVAVAFAEQVRRGTFNSEPSPERLQEVKREYWESVGLK